MKGARSRGTEVMGGRGEEDVGRRGMEDMGGGRAMPVIDK